MSSSQVTECAPCYELTYDEKLDSLRDQTFHELKATFGKNNKIKCNCWGDRNREYKVETSIYCISYKITKTCKLERRTVKRT